MVWPLACPSDNCLLHFYLSSDYFFFVPDKWKVLIMNAVHLGMSNSYNSKCKREKKVGLCLSFIALHFAEDKWLNIATPLLVPLLSAPGYIK